MATLLSHVQHGRLVKFDAELPDHVQPQRIILMVPRVLEQIEKRIVGSASAWQTEIAPEEQLADLLSGFCEGVELTYGWHFKDMLPHEHDVWELKRPDIRVFGWFHKRNCFVATGADLANQLKKFQGLYAGYIRQAVEDRAALCEGTDSWVKGSNPNDVISNWRETP